MNFLVDGNGKWCMYCWVNIAEKSQEYGLWSIFGNSDNCTAKEETPSCWRRLASSFVDKRSLNLLSKFCKLRKRNPSKKTPKSCYICHSSYLISINCVLDAQKWTSGNGWGAGWASLWKCCDSRCERSRNAMYLSNDVSDIRRLWIAANCRLCWYFTNETLFIDATN